MVASALFSVVTSQDDLQLDPVVAHRPVSGVPFDERVAVHLNRGE